MQTTRRNLIATMWILLLVVAGFSAGIRVARAQTCGQDPCQDYCNYLDGSTGGKHSSGSCHYSSTCSCWCLTEQCASSKCGNGTVQQCQTQEACQLYASGQLSFCENSSGC